MRPYNVISPIPLAILGLTAGFVYLGVKTVPELKQRIREDSWVQHVQGKEEHWKKIFTSYNAQANALISNINFSNLNTSNNNDSSLQSSNDKILQKEQMLRRFDLYINERFSNYALRDNFVTYDSRKSKALEKLVSK